MKSMGDNSVDLVFCSPPYEDARTYGVGFKLKGQAWVDWAVERYVECNRICSGLVAWVVEGKTRNYRYSANACIANGGFAQGGRQAAKAADIPSRRYPRKRWPGLAQERLRIHHLLKARVRLPWSDNTAMGKPPVWAPGGAPSHRMANGRRVHKLHTKADANGKRQQGITHQKSPTQGM